MKAKCLLLGILMACKALSMMSTRILRESLKSNHGKSLIMAKSLNDQKPKPRLGNDPNLHGKTSVDNAGGANPPPLNPSNKKRK